METWQVVTIALTATGLAFTILWSLAGKPEPLSLTNLRRPINWTRRKQDELRAARAEKEAKQAAMQQEAERVELRSAFHTSALRVHNVLRNHDRFHSAELVLQRRKCKQLAIHHMKANGCEITRKSAVSWWQLERCETGALLTTFHANAPFEEQMWIVVRWHPDSAFNPNTSPEAEDYKRLEILLVEPLTGQEICGVGWFSYDGYLNDWPVTDAPFLRS